MTVPGGCRSQGCHGYLLRSLAAPFYVIRHLPHTHLLLMGLMDNLKRRIKCQRPSFVVSACSLHSIFNLSYLTIPVEESGKFHKGWKQSGKAPRIWAPPC